MIILEKYNTYNTYVLYVLYQKKKKFYISLNLFIKI